MRAAMVIKQYFSTAGNPVGIKEVAELFKTTPRAEYLSMAAECARQMNVKLEVDDAKAPVVSRSAA